MSESISNNPVNTPEDSNLKKTSKKESILKNPMMWVAIEAMKKGEKVTGQGVLDKLAKEGVSDPDKGSMLKNPMMPAVIDAIQKGEKVTGEGVLDKLKNESNPKEKDKEEGK